ncbi:N-acetyltransferase [Paenibacillus sp. MWE-103]|uniref:N-acetyltransferase n=1 Tax=Paenibacillus artemisiicola TaxID=1172618 RepID=A0ABS3WL29_9BACL|nr:N-acetyltransferase [Paenibacillus artemisiicola]
MHIRRALIVDTESVYELIDMYAVQGQLLHRTRQSIYEHLQCFYVAVDDVKRIMGVASLHILDRDLAEIRSLVVLPGMALKGIGRALVDALVKEATILGIPRVIALTYQDGFFEKCGFVKINKETLSQKIWKDCLHCSKYNNCDEIAMQIMV